MVTQAEWDMRLRQECSNSVLSAIVDVDRLTWMMKRYEGEPLAYYQAVSKDLDVLLYNIQKYKNALTLEILKNQEKAL